MREPIAFHGFLPAAGDNIKEISISLAKRKVLQIIFLPPYREASLLVKKLLPTFHICDLNLFLFHFSCFYSDVYMFAPIRQCS